MSDAPGRDPDGPVPMARLLAMAFRDLVDGLHLRLAEQGWDDVRPAYGFVLLAGRQNPLTGTDIAALLGTTKQAASKLVDAMVTAGLVERRSAPHDARSKLVELTAHGRDFLAAVEQIYADLESGWASVIGTTRLERMRADLLGVLRAGHDGGLPAIRPTW